MVKPNIEEQRTSILKTIRELQESWASFDEVKYTVDTFLEETGIEPPSKGGTFIDTIRQSPHNTVCLSFIDPLTLAKEFETFLSFL